ELAAAVEELRKRLLAIRSFECVVLLDCFPWQRPPFTGELVPKAVELLLLDQQRLARIDPLVVLDHFMHRRDPSSVRSSPQLPPSARTTPSWALLLEPRQPAEVRQRAGAP